MIAGQQADLQEMAWSSTYPGMERFVIESRNQRIGRVYIQRRKSSIWIIDLALLPGRRNSGVGLSVLNGLMKEATELQIPLRGHVMKSNSGPLRLFQRIGFVIIADAGEYFEVEWK